MDVFLSCHTQCRGALLRGENGYEEPGLLAGLLDTTPRRSRSKGVNQCYRPPCNVFHVILHSLCPLGRPAGSLSVFLCAQPCKRTHRLSHLHTSSLSLSCIMPQKAKNKSLSPGRRQNRWQTLRAPHLAASLTRASSSPRVEEGSEDDDRISDASEDEIETSSKTET